MQDGAHLSWLKFFKEAYKMEGDRDFESFLLERSTKPTGSVDLKLETRKVNRKGFA